MATQTPTSNFDISRVHPNYQTLAPWWQEGLDFYRGGVHVLQPGREIGAVYFAKDAAAAAGTGLAGEPTEAEGATSAAEYTATKKKSYLWSHERERENRFDDRQRRLGHFPVFQPVIDIHADAILRLGLRLNDGRALTGPWKDISEDADLRGTSLEVLSRDALTWAMAMSRVHAVVDFPRLEQTPNTLAEQRSWGLRPWINLITPLDLVNWALDETGKFTWAVVRELEPDWRQPGEPDSGREYWYRLWTRDAWYLYGVPRDPQGKKLNQGKMVVVDADFHNLGKVPIATLWTDRDPAKSLFTQSPFATLQRCDRVILNLLSLLHEIDYGQTFTTWFFPDPDRLGTGDVEMGVHDAVTGPQTPIALSPDEQMAAGLMTRLKAHIDLARMLAGAGRGNAEKSIEARSGEAYGYESEQKRHQMARLAESAEDFVNECLDLCGQWMGQGGAPKAALPRNFDMKSLGRKINEATTLGSMDLGPKAMKFIKKNLAEQMLRELGAGEKEVQEMLKAIDERSEKLIEQSNKPPPPTPPTDGGPPKPTMSPEDGARVRDGEKAAA